MMEDVEIVRDGSSKPPSGSCLDLAKPLNAISPAPDGDRIVAAGRDVLKIYDVRPHDTNQVFTEVESLRPTEKKLNLSYSAVDVQWHPTESNKIATAATNGAVVIWNVLHRDGRTQKRERVIVEHTRTVNRLSWHPGNAYNLLSGSQDGTMKLWDIRDPNAKAITFDAKSTSVRDVQFNPFYSNYFGAAFDNGTVQVWDIRKPNAFERRFTAHEGLVMTICWHPEEKSIIASGGRDRLIKIWDLNPRASNPKHTIQTIASVGRLQWQPNFPTRIASTASLVDCQIHVWDSNKPFIPLSSVVGHRDVVTGFIWHKTVPDCIIACSKDGTLRCHNLKEAYRPYQHIRTVGLSWNVRNELANLHDFVDRDNPTAEPGVSAPAKQVSSIFSRSSAGAGAKTTKDSPNVNKERKSPVMYPKVPGVVKIQTPMQMHNAALFDHYSFQHLAHNYRYKGTFTEVCEHNAKEARSVKQFQIAQSWMVLKTLYADIDSESSTPARASSTRTSNGSVELESGMGREGDAERLSFTPKGSFIGKPHLNNSNSTETLPVVESMDDYLLPQELAKDAVRRAVSQEPSLPVKRSFGLTDSDTSIPLPLHPSLPGSGLANGGTTEGPGNIALRKSTGTATTQRHSNMITMGKGEGGIMDIHSITAAPFPSDPPLPPASPALRRHGDDDDGFDDEAEGSDDESEGYDGDVFSRVESASHINGVKEADFIEASIHSPPLHLAMAAQVMGANGGFGGGIARWCYESVVREMLEFYGNQGDVQTCVTMALALQGHLPLDKKTTTQWFLSYIELLHRLQLWSAANEIIRICPIDDIRAINQKSTTVHTNCPGCGRPLYKVGWACEHCNKPTNTCSVCHQIVKGIYVWCQGCGHGGHIQHMYEWFEKKKQAVCPAACAHLCTARDFVTMPLMG